MTPPPAGHRGPRPGPGNPAASPTRSSSIARRRDDLAMGMNPHHQHRRSNWDYVYVGAALVVALAVLAWAFLG